MKLILIPPYQNPVVKVNFLLREIVDNLEKKEQLEGVEVDIDEGYPVESPSETRDEEFFAGVRVGIIKKVKEYSETGKYDAILSTCGVDPGFAAARLVSKIPFEGVIHSSVHVASLIGERFSLIHTVASSSLTLKHCVESYGFGHKLASVRFLGRSSTSMYGLVHKYKKEERIKVPQIKKVIDDFVTQCTAAIEKDRADSIIFGGEPQQIFADVVRQKLDEAGYSEIPIICGVSAGVAMAKAMVNMKLVKAPRAYPSASLKAKPEYW